MARAWRFIGVFVVVTSYFGAAPFGYAAFALLRLVPTRDPDRRARRLQGILTRAFGFMHAVLRLLGIVDFDPRTLEGEIPEGPCVLVANHPTLMDVSAIIATVGNLSSAVKPLLFRSFWAHALLAQAAQFEGASSDPRSLERVLDDAVDRLARGYRVLIFPEGTRSPAQGLHRFGRTAFEIAVRADVPVVPIVVECTPRWLSKDQSVFDPPTDTPRLRLRALPAVHPASLRSCSRSLRDVVAEAIREQLDRSVAQTPDRADENHAGIT
jgi:1-acyl-sn-glycerol-3-phosphate acyltransferase